MFDTRLRPLIDPPLNRFGAWLAARGIAADMLTVAAFVTGLLAASAVLAGWFLVALGLMLAGRLLDGLDGAVARATRTTDVGGYLDITLDFAFYGIFPLAFAIHDPAANALAAAALIASFYVNGGSFLAYAVLAEKRGLKTDAQGRKSIFYLAGLAEGAETIAIFAAMCLWPAGFAVLAWAFAALCLLSASARIIGVWRAG